MSYPVHRIIMSHCCCSMRESLSNSCLLFYACSSHLFIFTRQGYIIREGYCLVFYRWSLDFGFNFYLLVAGVPARHLTGSRGPTLLGRSFFHFLLPLSPASSHHLPCYLYFSLSFPGCFFLILLSCLRSDLYFLLFLFVDRTSV